MGLAASGLLDKQISAELGITYNTLRTYWHRIRQKCGNLTRAGLVAEFVRNGSLPTIARNDPPSLNPVKLAEGLSQSSDVSVLRRAVYYYATAFQRATSVLNCAERAVRVIVAMSGADQLNTRQAYLQECCRILVEEGGFVMAWVGLRQFDKAKSIRTLASAGDTTGYLTRHPFTWAETKFGLGPGGRAMRTGEIQITHDFLADPTIEPWREAALKAGFQSSMAIPLKDGDTVFGNLAVYAREPDAFAEAERSALEEYAKRVAAKYLQLPEATRAVTSHSARETERSR